MARNARFDTVAQAQRLAKRRLPHPVYMALVAGTERGQTLADNLAAFAEIGFAPHIAGVTSKRELSTKVMGQQISMPVILSPAGVQAVHPDGEVAVARAAAAHGTAVGLSSFASKPIEEVVAANPQTFFQIYWTGGREQIVHRLARAKAAGAAGLILTLDWSFARGCDWGRPPIPETLNLKALTRLAPGALARPSWLRAWLSSGSLPDLTVPNMAVDGKPAPTFFQAYQQWMQSDLPSWDDVRWLRQQWDGPFMVKGVMRIDDARRAVDIGATSLSVSNHGGNNIDGTPASIRALPALRKAVGNDIEIVVDGGIRRGSDVVKALALGADTVLIGRAYLWGLATNGQAGVENVLDILRAGIDSTLLGLGRASVAELDPTDVLVPDGFAHHLDETDAHR